jgi:hypothetical protein
MAFLRTLRHPPVIRVELGEQGLEESHIIVGEHPEKSLVDVRAEQDVSCPRLGIDRCWGRLTGGVNRCPLGFREFDHGLLLSPLGLDLGLMLHSSDFGLLVA